MPSLIFVIHVAASQQVTCIFLPLYRLPDNAEEQINQQGCVRLF